MNLYANHGRASEADPVARAVDAVIVANPDKVAQARTNPVLIGWFVGSVLKAVDGKSDAQAVRNAIATKIDAS